MNDTQVMPIERAEVYLSGRNWPFPQAHALEIDRHWQRRTAENPKLFNGHALLLDSWSLSAGKFQGTCLVTDYRSFLYWREHDAPDRSVANFFAAAVLHSWEDWLIVARMGPHHSSAGLIFPPCGSLHTDDIDAGRIDLDGNILREIKEETGIELSLADLEERLLIRDRAKLAYVRVVRLPKPASKIVKQIENYLAAATDPELSEILVVKGRADIIEPAMPAFAVAYIKHALA
jgi:8-oxo-dGTP pyrophosphatase MutT (NUDIX family)